MVGRLSTYAKNRIINLRFQLNSKIKHIAQALLQEDNIKVSRESISTFLKKYIDTKSIHDKPRSGRNKKLTSEEIELIGEVTRLNRDITAPKIKQYLNLNVSTHTILRASKLFEWNKHNPNSNQAKKAAALERQLNGEAKKRKTPRKSKAKKLTEHDLNSDSLDGSHNVSFNMSEISLNHFKDDSLDGRNQLEKTVQEQCANLNLISDKEIFTIKNLSSSPMVFATKILLKIFDIKELYGHNVSGKTFSKSIQNKKALDQTRINYIKWLVENNFETSNKECLWKMCRTAINKVILIHEKKANKYNEQMCDDELLLNEQNLYDCFSDLTQANPIKSLNAVDMNDTNFNLISSAKLCEITNEQTIKASHNNTDSIDIGAMKQKTKTYNTRIVKSRLKPNSFEENSFEDQADTVNLNLLSDTEIMLIKDLYCSPMIFATKILTKIFEIDELYGHNLSGKVLNKHLKPKKPLDESRVLYIRYLVEKYFVVDDKEELWKSCRKAIGRVLRNIEKKIDNESTHLAENAKNFVDEFGFEETNSPFSNKNVSIQYEPQHTNTNHTVVLLIDDPEQQRQMMLEQELEDSHKYQLQSSHQHYQELNSPTYHNLSNVNILSLESNCY